MQRVWTGGRLIRRCYASTRSRKSIKVGKRFIWDGSQVEEIERVAGGGMEEKVFVDQYYDTKNFNFTTSDVWIKERDEWTFLCDIPLDFEPQTITKTEQYNLLRTKPEIIKFLFKFLNHPTTQATMDIKTIVTEANLLPFAQFTTKRKEFLINSDQNDITIKFDHCPELQYNVAEASIMVLKEEEIPKAEKILLNFCNNLSSHDTKNTAASIPLQYIYINNPQQFKLIEKNGLVMRKGLSFAKN
eukprot:TRINITY_DN7019_c0_g1_i1.p1 TRINITY_DN7019_c0_g1~~TRINITY_DN7019_c0_g1_i1.p1  ORF type:complete len:244 (+),score=57.19 TRINITY_DN7019_c0_g1_i1:14-745(+)